MQSALYRGKVHHARHVPKKHAFSYEIFLFWLHLDELDEVQRRVTGFSQSRWRPVRFKRSDYLGDPQTDLKHAVLARMTELAGTPLEGDVFLLGQTRMFGLYFSPVNFYYLRNAQGSFTHVLAEVSNTPWNQRHHYLIDLAVQQDSEKAFHVSPFNPMDMQYQWNIHQPDQTLRLHLGCHKQGRHFDASLHLVKQKLNSQSLLHVMLSIPSMTVKTVVGIYWQALKLYFKGVPIYDHPKQPNKEEKCLTVNKR